MAGGSRHAEHGVRAMIPVPVARETGSRRRDNFRKGSQAVHACVNAARRFARRAGRKESFR